MELNQNPEQQARDRICHSCHVERSDLDYSPFGAQGGLGKMWQLFGESMVINQPERLSPAIQTLCMAGERDFCLSMASVWEMQIKCQLGKLALDLPIMELVSQGGEHNGIQLINIELAHIDMLGKLLDRHKDPFPPLDRSSHQRKIDRAISRSSLKEFLTTGACLFRRFCHVG